MKGFHLTLAKHLPHRDDEGWKLSDLEWIGHIENKIDQGKYSRSETDALIREIGNHQNITPDIMVLPVPRFHQCLTALLALMESDTPPIIIVRTTTTTVVIYGFVDASGSGFGSTLLLKGGIHYRIGTWSSGEDENSSNWREFENLVCEVEEAGEKGWLTGGLLILATDNQVVESALHKGNSSSEKLFNLILRLRKVEMKYAIKLLITHVAGTRMMAQGTDGVSRGSLREGVAVGKEMISFCPWGRTALESEKNLKPWMQTWLPTSTIFLEPKDWYIRGQDVVEGKCIGGLGWPNIVSGTYVW